LLHNAQRITEHLFAAREFLDTAASALSFKLYLAEDLRTVPVVLA